MKATEIIAIISLCVSAISILATIIIAKYQLFQSQSFEKEKIKLDLFADFISHCTKKTAGVISNEETINFTNSYVKLMLVSNKEINAISEKLYNTVSSDNSSESIKLLDEATQLMWCELKLFNETHSRKK